MNVTFGLRTCELGRFISEATAGTVFVIVARCLLSLCYNVVALVSCITLMGFSFLTSGARRTLCAVAEGLKVVLISVTLRYSDL